MVSLSHIIYKHVSYTQNCHHVFAHKNVPKKYKVEKFVGVATHGFELFKQLSVFYVYLKL